ncbi:MAG: hemerythrin domain-containing protein [Magnetospirillum sp. WYHS-4]
MAKVELLDTFVIGHPRIDADHQKLIDLVNQLDDAVTNGELKSCKVLFDDFIEAARDHFAREEQVLRAAGFPRLTQHCVYHWGLLQRAHSVRRMCGDMTDMADIRDCFDSLVSFMVDDVILGDMDFKSFLQERGLARH